MGLYEFGALESSDLHAFLDHLIECEFCYNQVYSLEPVANAFRNHRIAIQRGEIDQDVGAVQEAIYKVRVRSFWLRKPVLAAASLLVALSAGLMAFYLAGQRSEPNVAQLSGAVPSSSEIAKGKPSPWEDVAIPKAVYTPPRDERIFRRPLTAFARAMAAYQENNFAEAINQLETLSQLDLRDGAEGQFYLGVSLLLVGRSQDAVLPLTQAVQLSVGMRREASHYYLALAYLKVNQPHQALAELEAVIEMKGERRAEAERLKQQVVNVTK